ncbi:4034_t:CDS:1, partial [Diversispora eburnea]
WLKFYEEKDLDIVGLTETWAKEKSCEYIFRNDIIKEALRKDKNADEYKYFWANGQKKKGSGVGIMIKKTWAKYVYKIDKYEGN